jgi:hypothetical protein
MSMVCPKCNAPFGQNLQCVSCGTRLLDQAARASARTDLDLPEDSEPWQHTPLGRILVGLFLAQGLAYSLRLLLSAALQGGEHAPDPLWTALSGLIVLQLILALGLLVGGALAGAGQERGTLLGSVVGLANGFVSVIVQQLSGDPVTQVLLYGQPILHLTLGAVGGMIGTWIWKPLPALKLANPPGELQRNLRPARRNPVLSAPVSWGRVLLASVVVLAGVFWPKAVLQMILDAGQGNLALSTHLQAQLVTWEITGLIVFLGAGFAGANSISGLKQGLCVGAMASLFFLAAVVGGRDANLDQIVFTLSVVWALSVAGGWFGGRLFPLVAGRTRRRALRWFRLSRADG